MSQNPNMYAVEAHIAEIYDQHETYTDDLALIRKLIGHRKGLRILEPFCGTGRLLIPLSQDGHTLIGLDQSPGMLAHAASKIPPDVRERVTLKVADVLETPWPEICDLVVLGGNCLYELATLREQEAVICSAAKALKPGGYVYVDNNHMEGDLDRSWQVPGVHVGFPTGICADGTRVESTTETIWFDVPARLAKFRRSTRVTLPDGKVLESEYIQQKHPVSAGEMRTWLERYGLIIEQFFGDRVQNPYTPHSPRAIFWARKA
ncbi:MAG: class I SAM-dependent methyltransferase [Chloroflexota bacterium]